MVETLAIDRYLSGEIESALGRVALGSGTSLSQRFYEQGVCYLIDCYQELVDDKQIQNARREI